MPRIARVKSHDSIFHVMVRSIDEVKLFKKNEDKKFYLEIIKYYQNIYMFKVYAYCLMDNHAHFIIDANGSDISKVMHGINFKYAMEFNKKYDRKGHLFQDRFKSKVVLKNDYLLTLSAYIHNNPTVIKKYKKCPEKYSYSSLPLYIYNSKDPFNLVETDFVLQLLGLTKKEAIETYYRYVFKCDEKHLQREVEFLEEGTEYRSGRTILLRDMDPNKVIEYLAEKTGNIAIMNHFKNRREHIGFKALCTVALRGLCNMSLKEIGKIFCNITTSRVSSLCTIGINMIKDDERYRGILEELIKTKAA